MTDVIHSPGTQHANADALSQAPHAPHLSETEATELLEDDQILTMGPSLLDDQQSISSDDPDVDIGEIKISPIFRRKNPKKKKKNFKIMALRRGNMFWS